MILRARDAALSTTATATPHATRGHARHERRQRLAQQPIAVQRVHDMQRLAYRDALRAARTD